MEERRGTKQQSPQGLPQDLPTAFPYTSLEECLAQLKLLTRFLNARFASDRNRLLVFGRSLQDTFHEAHSIATGDPWTAELSRLGSLTLSVISEDDLVSPIDAPVHPSNFEPALSLLITLAKLIPKELAFQAPRYYSVLSRLLQRRSREFSTATFRQLLEAVCGLLKPITPNTLHAYRACGLHFLTTAELHERKGALNMLAEHINYKVLAKSLAHEANGERGADIELPSSTDDTLWLLAHFISLYTLSAGQLSSVTQESDFVVVVSALLSSVADEIVSRIDSNAMTNGYDGDHTAKSPATIPAFVREQIDSLRQQNGINSILSYIGQSGLSISLPRQGHQSPGIARSLATYLLTLIRVFPKHAEEIRMWLYRGSAELKGSTGTSAIEYFWSASQQSRSFRKIRDSHRNVVALLRPPEADSSQIGRAQPSRREVEDWRHEWDAMFLFLEMYTFTQKFMDDEEFLSGTESEKGGRLTSGVMATRDGALPLQDVKELTSFLKNLAFALYWNASDLAESNATEVTERLGAYLGATESTSVRKQRQRTSTTARAAVSSVPISHLKGLVTGVLRTLHERDSRRKIFPKGHWLMTSQLDLTGFIPAVVAEEEKRHEIQDEDEDDYDDDDLGNVLEAEDDESHDWSRPFVRSNHAFGRTHNPSQAKLMEARRRKQEHAKRQRQQEQLAPRIEILRNLPFFIPFETRVQVFREFVHRDQIRRRNGFVDPDMWRMSVAHSSQGRGPDGRPAFHEAINRHHAEIHRESVFDDAYNQFYDLGEELKEPIQISFIDKFDTVEAGIDGGGVTKEFLTSVTSEAFDPEKPHSMFIENDQRSLYPNPNSFQETAESLRRLGYREDSEEFRDQLRDLLRRYEFLGRVIGKCLYEGILVDINFAGFFLLKWALTGGSTAASNESAYRASINDLRDLDEGLYQGLLKLKNYSGDVESDFSLNFTVSDSLMVETDDGMTTQHNITHDLRRDGSQIPVTNINRLTYISMMATYRLQQQPQRVTNSFLKGLGQIIQPIWLAMFNQRELQTLVGGDTSEVDVSDLRRNTQYSGVYDIGDDGQEHRTIKLFWQVLRDMDDKDRRKVLKFVTSTPRAPLLGFSHLNPRFSIRDSGDDQVRLPSTSTCVNLLKLPRYSDARVLKEKLLYAVNAGAGFDLS